MQTFNVKSPVEWETIQPGDIMLAEVVKTTPISFSVIASEKCNVYWAPTEDMKDKVLVAASDCGQFTVGIIAGIDSYFEFDAPHDAVMSVRRPLSATVIPATEEETFTSAAPMRRRNSDMDKVMELLRLNEQKREKQYKAEAQRRDAKLASVLEELKLAKEESAETETQQETPEDEDTAQASE